MDAKTLVQQMTLEEKASLCSGLDFWHLKGVERLGLAPIMVTDGPHGLRKQAGDADHLGINQSVPATCFPTASATACSFDRALMREIGVALGEECQQEQVAVILGPGANGKRSPLCGRNFEYISEDPLVTGQLAGALIEGVQSQGVGTSLKHYAANNQERFRMTGDSVVDERALREIYLAGFEGAVKKGRPWTVMCSYNRLDGTYASENKRLLNDILRDEWGFEGLVMTDWGATNDRVAGVRAGLDLEMPGSGGGNDALIVQAVRDGSLAEAALDAVATRVAALILKAKENEKPGCRYDAEAHHALARRAAAESCVLLKNDEGILPLAATCSVAVIGAFAKTPRYQGAGSSKINPPRMDCALDALAEQGLRAEYAEGYSLARGAGPDPAMIDQACNVAAGKEVVLLFAGLPDEYESEGFDRTALEMPPAHVALIEAVAAVNPNVVVLLQCGAPVVMPWADRVRAIVLLYLGGQAGGSGAADVILGRVNPGGRLAETFPLALADVPSTAWYGGTPKTVEYRESLYVGYRWFDTVNRPVAYPFGYGLSYTCFEYTGLALDKAEYRPGETLAVSITVKNTGAVAGAEVVQVYVGLPSSAIFRPARELRGFEKVWLQPGEEKTVQLAMDTRSFAYYNAPAKDWAVEGGAYTVWAGPNSRDLPLSATVQVAGDGRESLLANLKTAAPAYYAPQNGLDSIPDAQFEALLGRPLPPRERLPGEPYDANTTLGEIKHTFIGRQMIKQIAKNAADMLGDDEGMRQMMDAMLMEMPLRALKMMSGGAFGQHQLDGLLLMVNGKFFKGLRMMRGAGK